ncbi:hypothetical protein ACN2WE_00095 [Streptomyces sp. cg28]|uniref:hypothetical protein n=1 Tax=Streptomyces sp. cg28 TaxID=3403457 RepID=UPI003B20F8C5
MLDYCPDRTGHGGGRDGGRTIVHLLRLDVGHGFGGGRRRLLLGLLTLVTHQVSTGWDQDDRENA